MRAVSTAYEPRVRSSHGFLAPNRNPFVRFASTSGASSSSSSGSGSSSSSNSSSSESDEDGSSQPSLRQRLRYLWKRYGWWAFGVYNLWSVVDFSLTWAVIHLYGADHIRDVETRARKWVGLDKREATDEEVAKWPLALAGTEEEEGVKRHMNNEEATKEVARKVVHEVKQHNPKGSSASNAGSTLWAEAVLAYTIHKTLLLPFRVMGTGAITPSFVVSPRSIMKMIPVHVLTAVALSVLPPRNRTGWSDLDGRSRYRRLAPRLL